MRSILLFILIGLTAPVSGQIEHGFVAFADARPTHSLEPASTQPADSSYKQLAARAIADLVSHWWVGEATTGHLVPTRNGYPVPGRGVLWPHAMVLCTFEGFVRATADPLTRQRIKAQWLFDKRQYTPAEMEACGPHTPSPWSDDAEWAAIYYLIAFEQTGDADALLRAKGLLRNIHGRWYDEQLGGGLWYNDKHEVKALYSAAYVYACLWTFEASGDTAFRKMALSQYAWIESHLLRPDHLYWCEYSAGVPGSTKSVPGPVGQRDPNRIRPASSVVFLGGNMAMGACQAYLYQLTGDDRWRRDALRTAAALSDHLTDAAGRYINDRDAYTNGSFASFWARRLVALPGNDTGRLDVLRRTADAIAAIRTSASYIAAQGPSGEGFYSADWDGHPVWELRRSQANMMHVSANSAAFVVAAAYAERARE